MSTAAPAVLIVVTSQATMGDTTTPTGLWLEELATPWYAFKEAGARITIASPKGGAGPIDPRSLKAPEPAAQRFLADVEASKALATTRRLADVDVCGFEILFFPGGHGTMWDLPKAPAVRAALEKVWNAGGIVAAVCHGPAALTNAYDLEGSPIVHGRTVAGFSNAEEDKAGLTSQVPFLLQDRLAAQGAHYTEGPAFKPHVARDGRLVTGQNPASSAMVASAALTAWRER